MILPLYEIGIRFQALFVLFFGVRMNHGASQRVMWWALLAQPVILMALGGTVVSGLYWSVIYQSAQLYLCIVGYFGITQQDCQNQGCCWAPADVSPHLCAGAVFLCVDNYCEFLPT